MDVRDDKPEAKPEEKHHKVSRFRRLLNSYSILLSSAFLAAAVLGATYIYQTKQYEMIRRQAEAQVRMTEVDADGKWRIERAEILSRNLQVLADGSADSIERRYGVLLALARGRIIDNDMAVSFALELGRHHADHMRSVLLDVGDKSYVQLQRSFVLTCEQRFGVSRDLPACAGDHEVGRSEALAQLVADEIAAGNRSPLVLLADEKQVQEDMARRAALFAPYLESLYQRRRFAEIVKFEAYSSGAQLVSAIVLAADHGEVASAHEADVRRRFHIDRQRWLEGYLLGSACGPECKGELVDLLLTNLAAGNDAYDHALAMLLERKDSESGETLSRLHDRLLWCRAPAAAIARLRDHVLVPLAAATGKENPSEMSLERLRVQLGLLALAPVPAVGEEEAARAAWAALLDYTKKNRPELHENYVTRRQAADVQRHTPSPAQRKANFCVPAQPAPPAP